MVSRRAVVAKVKVAGAARNNLVSALMASITSNIIHVSTFWVSDKHTSTARAVSRALGLLHIHLARVAHLHILLVLHLGVLLVSHMLLLCLCTCHSLLLCQHLLLILHLSLLLSILLLLGILSCLLRLHVLGLLHLNVVLVLLHGNLMLEAFLLQSFNFGLFTA